ncbi:MAG TPA: SDR family oxidoreductase [Kofleriaceae bacterium]|nr:SDR family oxidoreductase [Kofleriaceae bacterium]
MSKILVVGAHGNVGSELVRLLQERGQTVVRATSRAPTQPDEVQLNLVTQQGISAALEGVERAFLLSPPGFTQQDRLLNPVVDEAVRRGVAKLVLMTAMGANADESGGLRKAELHLERSGVPYNVIRPNWFMQNFNSYWRQGIREAGKILLATGSAKGSYIDARDIAAVAAELLTSDRFDNRELDLTGPRAIDHHEIAAILSRELGKRIVYEDVTPETMHALVMEAGLPRDYADLLIGLLHFFKLGYAEPTSEAVQQITGRPARSFEEYAHDHRAAWLG